MIARTGGSASCLILAVLMATSCSTYSGQKLGTTPPPENKPIVAEGVPYNLVRPEYTLSRTPPAAGSQDPTYALTVAYVPDPSQRYSLKIDPGVLKAPDFTMKFGSGGVLSGTTATVTEQVTPFITAIGSFAASVIAAGTTFGVFDKISFREEFTTLLENKCPDASDVIRFGMKPNATVSQELAQRVKDFKDDDAFLAQFHYLTGKERECLSTLLANLKKNNEDKAKKALKDLADMKAAFLKAFPDETAFVDRVALAVKTDDRDELDALAKEVEATATNGQLSDKGKGQRKLLVLAELARQATADTQLQTALQAFVDTDAATWRARHVLFLERQIEQIGLLVLQQSLNSTDAEKPLARLRSERALTMDTVELQKRADALATFIQAIKDKSVEGGTAPATAEYAVARAELDAVNAAIDARRARILADAAPPPPAPVTAFAGVPVKRVMKEDIEASQKPGWFNGSGQMAPKFVLVLSEEEK